HALVALAVGFVRRDGNVDLIAGILSVEGRFKTGNDVAGAVQVVERSASLRGIDHLPVVAGQRVIDADDLVLCDAHEMPSLSEQRPSVGRRVGETSTQNLLFRYSSNSQRFAASSTESFPAARSAAVQRTATFG